MQTPKIKLLRKVQTKTTYLNYLEKISFFTLVFCSTIHCSMFALNTSSYNPHFYTHLRLLSPVIHCAAQMSQPFIIRVRSHIATVNLKRNGNNEDIFILFVLNISSGIYLLVWFSILNIILSFFYTYGFI